MTAVDTVQAKWDDEARVWVATSDDVPGLCAEAANFEALTEAVLELAPELLLANGIVAPGDPRDVPIRITAERRALAHPAD